MALLFSLMLGATSTEAVGQTVQGIASKLTQPLAVRGGVLLLPLTAERHGRNWPATINVTCTVNQKQQTLAGQVAWMHSASATYQRQWTDDPRELLVRAVQPEDDSTTVAAHAVLGPYLLIQLPTAADGILQLNRQQLQPRWFDDPQSHQMMDGVAIDRSDDLPTLELTPAPDRPDPVSPFEYWRWVLLAQRLEMTAPAPFGGEIEQMIARHFADMWRIGLRRLSSQSERLAEQCRHLLTQTCIDRRQPFAAWVIDPAAVGALLLRLLDFSRPDNFLLTDAATWIDEQPPFMCWIEQEFGNEIRLAIVTPRNEPMVVSLAWVNTDEPPMGVRIEPGVLTQISVARPAAARPSLTFGARTPDEQQLHTLQLSALRHRIELTLSAPFAPARPPGVSFPPLHANLTLADIQMGRIRPVAPMQATAAQFRRIAGRWELFVECRRSKLAPGDQDHAPTSGMNADALPELMTSVDDLRGIEAITVLLGPEIESLRITSDEPDDNSRGPIIWLTIPENGAWRLVRGSDDGMLQIHRVSYGDRWFCRVVLPESWFPTAENSHALVGLIRGHDDNARLETAPNATLPWRSTPARIAIDLSTWDDLPTE